MQKGLQCSSGRYVQGKRAKKRESKPMEIEEAAGLPSGSPSMRSRSLRSSDDQVQLAAAAVCSICASKTMLHCAVQGDADGLGLVSIWR